MDNKEVQYEKDAVSLWSFILGLVSVLFFDIGIIPIVAVVLGIVGLNKTKNNSKKGRWMAVVGLVLGSIYTLVYMSTYGHL